jgi:hypothetical protein
MYACVYICVYILIYIYIYMYIYICNELDVVQAADADATAQITHADTHTEDGGVLSDEVAEVEEVATPKSAREEAQGKRRAESERASERERARELASERENLHLRADKGGVCQVLGRGGGSIASTRYEGTIVSANSGRHGWFGFVKPSGGGGDGGAFFGGGDLFCHLYEHKEYLMACAQQVVLADAGSESAVQRWLKGMRVVFCIRSAPDKYKDGCLRYTGVCVRGLLPL